MIEKYIGLKLVLECTVFSLLATIVVLTSFLVTSAIIVITWE